MHGTALIFQHAAHNINCRRTQGDNVAEEEPEIFTNLKTFILCLMALSLSACSTVGNLTSPFTDPVTDQSLASGNSTTHESSTVLWGYYDLFVDPDDWTITASLNRSAMYTVNVTNIINNMPAGLGISMNGTTPGTGYVDVDLDITITHPLNDAKFDGYDVRGVFLGQGTGVLDWDDDLTYAIKDIDPYIPATDGYTRWFNPTEFGNPGLFGYAEGKYASHGFLPSATLNPYRYFADGIGPHTSIGQYIKNGPANPGYFLHGTAITRNYYIRFPVPTPGFKYGYAIIADWEGPDPSQHPSHAREAIGCDAFYDGDVYYIDENENGGTLRLIITLFDWISELDSGVMKDFQITVESTVTSVPYTMNLSEMVPSYMATPEIKFEVEIPADTVSSFAGNEYWVIVEYPGEDFSNPFGIPNDTGNANLVSAFRSSIPVSPTPIPSIDIISPNGGEEIKVTGDFMIEWENHFFDGDVKIEYSNDNFNNDSNLIADFLANTGEYLWEDIPCDILTNLKVRVKAIDDPAGNYDISDGTFKLVDSGYAEIIGTENNDLCYASGVTNSRFTLVGTTYSDQTKNDCKLVQYLSCNTPNLDLTWGGSEHDYCNDVFVTGGNYGLVTGSFRGTADFDPGPGFDIRDIKGGSDVFVSYFNPSGNFVWTRTFGGTGQESGQAVTYESGEGVYVGGYFEGTVDFDPESGVYNKTALGYVDAYLLKLDSTGHFEWVRTWGASGVELIVYDAALDDDGDVYVCGYFTGAIDFDPTAGFDIRLSNGGYDCFVTKYNSDGVYSWTRTWGGSGYDIAYSLDVASNDVVFIGGYYNDSVDFDPGSGSDVRVSNGKQDCFITSFNSSAIFQMAITFGGPENEKLNEVNADALGRLHVAGNFQDTVDFDPDPGNTEIHTSNGGNDGFSAAFNTTLGTLAWVNTWGSVTDDVCTTISPYSISNVFVAGSLSGACDLSPNYSGCTAPTDWKNPYGQSDMYFIRYRSQGCW